MYVRIINVQTGTHTHLLPDNWPAESNVQDIVEKSTGQFIYASSVLKFCAMAGHHPENQLNIVRGLRPCGSLTPFAHLDALYQHIFSQVWDLEATSLILAGQILTNSFSPTLKNWAEFCRIEIADIYSALAPLQSVLDFTSSNEIQFLHASLPDFLLDKERSQRYHINRTRWSTRLSIMAHKFVIANGDRRKSHIFTHHLFCLIVRFRRLHSIGYVPQ